MAKKVWPEVREGQIWRDRDQRSYSGNRRVCVTSINHPECGEYIVFYRQVVGENNRMLTGTYRSKMHRFQRAFELVGA